MEFNPQNPEATAAAQTAVQHFIQSSVKLESVNRTLNWRVDGCEHTLVVINNIAYVDDSQALLLQGAGCLYIQSSFIFNIPHVQIVPNATLHFLGPFTLQVRSW